MEIKERRPLSQGEMVERIQSLNEVDPSIIPDGDEGGMIASVFWSMMTIAAVLFVGDAVFLHGKGRVVVAHAAASWGGTVGAWILTKSPWLARVWAGVSAATRKRAAVELDFAIDKLAKLLVAPFSRLGWGWKYTLLKWGYDLNILLPSYYDLLVPGNQHSAFRNLITKDKPTREEMIALVAMAGPLDHWFVVLLKMASQDYSTYLQVKDQVESGVFPVEIPYKHAPLHEAVREAKAVVQTLEAGEIPTASAPSKLSVGATLP